MWTNLPRRPRSWNLTTPSILAKSVSSLPRPTFWPGLNFVPRWRTMIVPPVTVWPPNAFTPRCWELESRPLRLEPCPFLCAMSWNLLPGTSPLAGGRQLDLVDTDPVQMLPVAGGPAERRTLLLLEHPDLRAENLAHEGRGHR